MKKFTGASSQQTGVSEAIAQLAGAWRLVTIEQADADGVIKPAKVSGLLIFTKDGQMAVQVRHIEATSADSPYSSGGYEASYGTVTLDPASGTFIYHVDGALVQSLAGQDLPRAYRFVEGQLHLTSTRDDEQWRAVWRRD